MRFFGTIISFMVFGTLAFSAKNFIQLHTKDLDQMMKDKKQVLFIYDANTDSTRKFVGIIPGAKLLSSSNDYDLKKELPEDKKSSLVFYCANEMCTASHTAANRALENGYTQVSVMVDGIYGWKKSGYTLAPANPPKEKDATNTMTPKGIDPQQAKLMTDKGEAVIVDVRESEERHEIIGGSLHFPLSQMKDENAWKAFKEKLPSSKTIIFHCAAGVRSKKAANKLSDEGFRTAYFEGPDQWKKMGLTLEKGPAQ